MLAPNTKAKLDIIRQGQEKSLTVTVGEMSNEHQAKADTSNRPRAMADYVAPANAASCSRR